MSRVPRTEDAVNQETHVGEETAPRRPEQSQEKLRGDPGRPLARGRSRSDVP